MNLRKFISGVSALAIAASAFAGMAVTAGATIATPSTATEGDVLTVSGISPTIDAVFKKDTATDATSEELYFGRWYVGSGSYGSFALAKFDITSYLTQYSEDYVLSSVTLNLMAKYEGTTGTINVSCANKVADDWDDTLTISDVKTLYGNAAASTIANDNPGAAYGNLDFDVTTAFTTTDTDGIVTLGMTTPNDGRKVYVASNENTTMAGPTLTLTFQRKQEVSANIVAKSGNVTLSTATVSGYAGTSYSYAPYAYIEKDGVFYKYDNIGSNGEVNAVTGTLEANMSDVELSYSEASDVVAYAEVNVSNRDGGHGAFAGAADNALASGGKDGGTVYGQAGANCIQTFTAPVTGKYNITVNAVGTSSGNNRSCYLTVDSTDTADSLGTLACNNGATAKQTVEVELTAGSHTFYYLSTGSISPRLDYMVVELVEEYTADLSAAVTQTGVENGTEEYAADSATWFVITVTNAGDAEGTYNKVSITDGTATVSASTPNATLAANAEVVYGGVIDGAYTFTEASVE